MKRLWLILAFGVLLPATARAEPIAISVQSSSGGFSGGTTAASGLAIDLGTVSMPAGSVGTYLISGLQEGANYAVSLVVSGISGWDALTTELLDPIGDDNDAADLPVQPAFVPAGYSTSNNTDGLSFAQDSALARSAVFAGGSATVIADERNMRDMLTFVGLGSGLARVTFGLRNYGSNGFLLRLSANGVGSHAPEPASMLLLGTGLAGLAAYRRRRALAS
jgi:PEP-CTERM motif-containing protein